MYECDDRAENEHISESPTQSHIRRYAEYLRTLYLAVTIAAGTLALQSAPSAHASDGREERDVAKDRVSLIEVNHVFDNQGRPVLCQAVFYDWSAEQGDYRVRAWRLLKSEHQFPIRNFEQGGYNMLFHDGGLLREVRADSVRESWTQYDVEREECDKLPQEHRAGLLHERQPGFIFPTPAARSLRLPPPPEATPPDPANAFGP